MARPTFSRCVLFPVRYFRVPSPPQTRVSSSWEDLTKLSLQRVDLGEVVVRRLERCRAACQAGLADARGAHELRAACVYHVFYYFDEARRLRNVASAVDAAWDADAERRRADAACESAIASLGKPISVDGDGWIPSAQIDAACARARAEGRNEALEALSERERLREKCALYKARVKQLEAELKNTMSDVPLGDDENSSGREDSLKERLALAEKRLAALAGTERAANLRRLEQELEERGHIISALRAALDDDASSTTSASTQRTERDRTPDVLTSPTTPSPLAADISISSDGMTRNHVDDDDDEDTFPVLTTRQRPGVHVESVPILQWRDASSSVIMEEDDDDGEKRPIAQKNGNASPSEEAAAREDVGFVRIDDSTFIV